MRLRDRIPFALVVPAAFDLDRVGLGRSYGLWVPTRSTTTPVSFPVTREDEVVVDDDDEYDGDEGE